jgi:hypothetical protein
MSLDNFKEELLSQITKAMEIVVREVIMAMASKDLKDTCMPLVAKTGSDEGTSNSGSKRPRTSEIRRWRAMSTKTMPSKTVSMGATRTGVRPPMSCETHEAAPASSTWRTCMRGVNAPRSITAIGRTQPGIQGTPRKKR